MSPKERKAQAQVSLFPIVRECQRLQDENENLTNDLRRWRECAEALGVALMNARWPKRGPAYDALLKLERLKENRA